MVTEIGGEVSATPADRATVCTSTGVPEQLVVLKRRKITVPVGVGAPTHEAIGVHETVALSWADVAAKTVVPVMSLPAASRI